MKTAVLDSGPARNASRSDAGGFAGSTQRTIPLVLEPARKTRRAVTREARAGVSGAARKPKRVVVPFSISKPKWEVPDARIQVPKPPPASLREALRVGVVWESLEFGFATVLLASAVTLIALAVTAAVNL